MHIVVVTGFYFPYTVPPAGCIKPYLLELAKSNNVEIVCPPSNIYYMKSHIMEGIKINYINSLPNRLLSYIKTNKEEHKNQMLTQFLFFVYRGLRYLKSLFSITPYETSLICPYVKRLQKIHKKDKIDVLISVSFDFYTHVSALKFKKIERNVKWITFTTDPLAYSEVNPIPKWKLKTAINVENNVYTLCDYCIVTEELYPNLKNDYHISPEKILKLPFLLLNQQIETKENIGSNINVLYAGYLYYEIRNPKTMLEVFSRVKCAELQLHVAGDRFIRQMLKSKFPHNIHIDGLVSREKYLALLGTSDILINLCNSVNLQAPSKLTELISTGKPIINFYYYEDSGYRMIERYPLGINIHNDADYSESAKRVENFISVNAHIHMSLEEVKTLFPEHTFAFQMPKIQNLINLI